MRIRTPSMTANCEETLQKGLRPTCLLRSRAFLGQKTFAKETKDPRDPTPPHPSPPLPHTNT